MKGQAKVKATYDSIDISAEDHRQTKHEVAVPPVVEYDTVEDDAPAAEPEKEPSVLEKAVATVEAAVDDAVKEVAPIVQSAVEEVKPIVKDVADELENAVDQVVEDVKL